MTAFDTVMSETQELTNRRIDGHPLLELVSSGKMQHQHYVAYLRETYHMVRHTPRMLSLAGARLDESRRELRDWFFEQVEEENNHDLFCIRDLAALGEDPDEVLAPSPGPGAWGLVSQNYYMATYGNPLGILGVASLTEGLGATTGAAMADVLTSNYDLKKNQVTFIRSHAGFDAKHIEEVKSAINDLTSDSDLEDIIQGRRMTIEYYAQMFDDVLAETA